MTYNELYDQALRIAIQAHKGQKDKSGREYIMHLIRVAERCFSLKAKIVALLHDTIEDTDVTVERLLKEGFTQEIVDAVLSEPKKRERHMMTSSNEPHKTKLAKR